MLLIAFKVTSMLAQMVSSQQRLREQKKVDEKLEAITTQLKTLDAKLDERTLKDARTAAQHLQRGLSSDVPNVQADEFRQARVKFAELIDLEDTGVTSGTSGAMSNAALICLGYWGSFQYFLLHDDFRNAAIQVYEAGARCPDQALLTFADCFATFYSQDYHALMAEPLEQLATAQQMLQRVRDQNHHDKVEGVVIGGAIAAVTLLTGGIGGLFAGAMGAKHVSDLMHAEDTKAHEQEIIRLTDLLDAQRAAFVEEAAHRKAWIENLPPAKMKPRAKRTPKPKEAQQAVEA